MAAVASMDTFKDAKGSLSVISIIAMVRLLGGGGERRAGRAVGKPDGGCLDRLPPAAFFSFFVVTINMHCYNKAEIVSCLVIRYLMLRNRDLHPKHAARKFGIR